MVVKGIQQFQLRQEFGSEEKTRATLRKVKEAGFDGIELNRFMLQKLPMSIRIICRLAGMPMGTSSQVDWPRLLQEAQLSVISLHDSLDSILTDSGEVVGEAKKLGTETIVITGMRKFDYGDDDQVANLVENLNAAGKLISAAGLNLLYHNHNVEFRRLSSGQTAFDYIVEHTDPKWLNFEFDSYWAAEAGCDVLGLMEKLGSRMKLYHLTDRGTRVSGKTNSILKSDCMELGFGNMPLVSFIESAKNYGVEAIILESHQNWLNKSGLESMQLSSIFLNKYIQN